MINRKLSLHRIAALVLLFCLTGIATAEDVKTLEIGAAAPDFSLPGIDGKTYTLKDFADAKILCMIFTCNHCPTAQAYEQRIIDVNKEYHDKGVALVAINPNNPNGLRLDELGYTEISDSFDDMKIRAKDRGFTFPYLYDGETKKMSHAYGVVATPQVFLFDAKRNLRYCGAIDDSEVKTVTHRYLRDALDAMLAGKPVPVETSRVFGCSTKWIEKSDAAKKMIEKWDQEPVDLKEIGVKDVAALVANDSKDLRLINVWATWCGPCTAEMPELVTIHREYRKRGFEVVTISIDEASRKDAALKVLTEDHASGPNYRYNADDKDALANALDKQWQGPLPYTLLVAPGGKIIYRHGGEIDPMELKKAIVGFLGRTY